MPMPLVIFHLKDNIERKTSNNIANNIEMEHPTPDESTSTGTPFTKVYRSHGKGNPTVTSKIFDPTEEDTAMSPLPC